MSVSVIIPCHNYAKYLPEAIESALAQTVKCEVIVIDDESTDETPEVEKKYKDKILYQRKISNGTAADARNYGLIFATKKYILPLDADDILLKDYAEIGSRFLNKHKEYDIFAPTAQVFGKTSGIYGVGGFSADIEKSNTLLYCSMFRKVLLREIGAYDAGIPYPGWEDWDLWFRAYKAGKKAYVYNEPLWKYREHDNSMTTESILPNINKLKTWFNQKHGTKLL